MVTSFSSLPKKDRLKIYSLAGFRLYPLRVDWPKKYLKWRYPCSFMYEPFRKLYRSLVLCNKFVYSDVISIIWSMPMYINVHDKVSLGIFSSLPQHILYHLEDITIDLRCQVFEFSLERDLIYRSDSLESDYCSPPFKSPGPEQNTFSEYLFGVGVSRWQQVAASFIPHLRSNHVNFTLLSDAITVAQASVVLKSLNSLPLLKKCNLHFGWRLNAEIRPLLRTKAAQLTGRAPVDDSKIVPFRYFDLPQEIRLCILQYTNLVTPSMEVEWNPRTGYLVRFFDCFFDWKNNGVDPDYKEREVENTTCLEWGICNCASRCFREPCLCPKAHTAFSSSYFDKDCKCWCPPDSMFLVSRNFRSDALQVFFSHNRFVVSDFAAHHIVERHEFPLDVDLGPLELEMRAQKYICTELGTFLRQIVPQEALPHLRKIDFVLGMSCKESLPPRSDMDKSLEDSLAYATPLMNIGALQINAFVEMIPRVHVDCLIDENSWFSLGPLLRAPSHTYGDLLQRLSTFKAAKNFYVHIYRRLDYTDHRQSPSPVTEVEDQLPADQLPAFPWDHWDRYLIELDLEKFVTTNSRIKHYRRDKYDQRYQSNWLRANHVMLPNGGSGIGEQWLLRGIYINDDSLW